MANNPGKDFTGTMAPPAHLRFDEEALACYMAENVDGFEGPLKVEKFKGGQSNPTYLLVTPAKKYVLRRKPPGKLLPSAHAVEREYRVMTALERQGFPTPKTYALCEDADVIGTTFFIMNYVEGRIFWDASLADVPRDQRASIFNALIDTLADLHGIDHVDAGLADYGKPGNYFARQIDRWAKQYKAAETTAIPEMDRLMDWLPQGVPLDDATSVVHGDFRLDNTIMHAREPRVVAVLDWELSTLGHPLADFTYFLMVYHFPPEMRGGLAGLDLNALGIPSLEEATERYRARAGRVQIGDLDFCFAYNMFRLASIAQGVFARALQGNASSDQGKKLGAQVAPLAQLAWSYARKAGA